MLIPFSMKLEDNGMTSLCAKLFNFKIITLIITKLSRKI